MAYIFDCVFPHNLYTGGEFFLPTFTIELRLLGYAGNIAGFTFMNGCLSSGYFSAVSVESRPATMLSGPAVPELFEQT
jgi:hypothetical protein